MIINSNGVNIDTNTMRTDSEIINLIKNNTVNMITRTSLKSFTVNQSVNTTQPTTLGTFDFNDDLMFEYHSIMIEFVGTLSMTAGTSNSSCYFDMLSDSGDSLTIGYLSVDKNTTKTLSNIRVLLQGTNPNFSSSKYKRTFLFGNEGIEFDGTFSGLVRVQPSNSPTSVKMNGTINIYGIK